LTVCIYRYKHYILCIIV